MVSENASSSTDPQSSVVLCQYLGPSPPCSCCYSSFMRDLFTFSRAGVLASGVASASVSRAPQLALLPDADDDVNDIGGQSQVGRRVVS